MSMNLEKFEDSLILNGTKISAWVDKKLAGEAKTYLSKNKMAKELHRKYKELDSKLEILGKISAPNNLNETIANAISKEKVNSENNYVFFLFNPKIFVPILSLCLVIAISLSIYKKEDIATEDQIYAYADQLMEEVQEEEELEHIENELEDYKEILKMI